MEIQNYQDGCGAWQITWAVTWVLIGVIVLVAIGLGVGVFFSGLLRGAEIIGQNPAVQNASEETKQFIDDKVDATVSSNNAIVITTDRFTYGRGDPVAVTVKNTGEGTLSFPNAALGLEIENVSSGEKFSVVAAEVVTKLGPGESKTITWQDSSAGAGDYTATVRTTPSDQSMTAQTSFEITG